MKTITLCLDPNTDTCLTLRFTVEGQDIVLRNEEQGIGYPRTHRRSPLTAYRSAHPLQDQQPLRLDERDHGSTQRKELL